MIRVTAHVVALSGGKDSTAMALRLAEVEPRDYRFFCTPTGNELPEVHAHWSRLETLLGAPIERVTSKGRTLTDWIRIHGALPNHRMRWCTRQLKIEPALAFLLRLRQEHDEVVTYVGLRADEPGREGGDYGATVTYDTPLRRWGWGVDDVWRYLETRGVCVPRRTDCAWCPFQRLVEWKRLNEEHAAIYDEGAGLEVETGHTFRSPGRDTWPAPLADLRAHFLAGRKIRGEAQYDERVNSCGVCRR